jgi:hypothetical protein
MGAIPFSQIRVRACAGYEQLFLTEQLGRIPLKGYTHSENGVAYGTRYGCAHWNRKLSLGLASLSSFSCGRHLETENLKHFS